MFVFVFFGLIAVGGTYWVEPNCGTPSRQNDQCGVHTNSGVPNKAFYNLAQAITDIAAISQQVRQLVNTQSAVATELTASADSALQQIEEASPQGSPRYL